MRVGIPRELKNNEHRVAMTPVGVRELTHAGHEVIVESGAGIGSSIPDDQYRAAGATISDDVNEVWDSSELLLKVKDPITEEFVRLHPGQVLFTYLHLAANRLLTEALVRSGSTALAYETVELSDGRLPLLAPMSEIAGRMATQVGAHLLESEQGGRGVLMGGVSGVAAARVVILGAGMAGQNAARIAQGMEAEVFLLDTNIDKLRAVDAMNYGRIRTLTSNRATIEELLPSADVVIGSVLIPGARAPKLVLGTDVQTMQQGSVLVDIAVDQGGCFETSRATTHADPTYQVGGVIHYCVSNMPGAVPHTSTFALTNVTLPYIMRLANSGLETAMREDPALAKGVNIYNGSVSLKPVAEAHNMEYVPLSM